MKNIYVKAVLLLLLGIVISGCDVTDSEEITGSGNLITVEESFTGFTEVKTGYAFESTITRDPDYSISVTLDDNLEKYLKVYKLGSILYVQMEDNIYSDAQLRIDITMPNIEKVDLSGASVCYISGFSLTHDLDIIVSGASNLTGTLNTEDLNI